jgi:hypothetical protein
MEKLLLDRLHASSPSAMTKAMGIARCDRHPSVLWCTHKIFRAIDVVLVSVSACWETSGIC